MHAILCCRVLIHLRRARARDQGASQSRATNHSIRLRHQHDVKDPIRFVAPTGTDAADNANEFVALEEWPVHRPNTALSEAEETEFKRVPRTMAHSKVCYLIMLTYRNAYCAKLHSRSRMNLVSHHALVPDWVIHRWVNKCSRAHRACQTVLTNYRCPLAGALDHVQYTINRCLEAIATSRACALCIAKH
jgi:hypothetical protein